MAQQFSSPPNQVPVATLVEDRPTKLLTRTKKLAGALFVLQIASLVMGNIGPFSIAAAIVYFMAMRVSAC